MSYKNKRTFNVSVKTYYHAWSGLVRVGNDPAGGAPIWGTYIGYPSEGNFITIPEAGNTFPPDPPDAYGLENADTVESAMLVAPVDCRLVGISIAVRGATQWLSSYGTVTGHRFGVMKGAVPGPGQTAADSEATTTWTCIGVLETSPAWQTADRTPDHVFEYSVSLDSADGDVSQGDCVTFAVQAIGTVDEGDDYLKSGAYQGVVTLTFDMH